MNSDRQAALEWQAEQDLLCSNCGKPRDESISSMDSDELVALGILPDYVAEKRRCRGCEVLGAAQREVRESDADPGSGLFFVLRETRVNGQEVS